MAKRRLRRNEGLFNFSLPKMDLDPDIKRGIFIVFILALGAISFLSLFNLAGALGIYLAKGMLILFGWGKWIFPLVLLAFGFLLYHTDKYWVRGATHFGLLLFFVSFLALLHLLVAFIPDPSALLDAGGAAMAGSAAETKIWSESIGLGFGGGYVGLFLASVFIKILGLWASLIIVFCLILISLMLLFNTTLTRLVGRESALARLIYHPIVFIANKIFRRSVKEEEWENEDEETEEKDWAALEEDEESEEEKQNSFKRKKIKEESAFAKTMADKPEFMQTEEKESGREKKAVESSIKKSNIKIDLPPDLLSEKSGKPTSGDIKSNTEIIRRTLENFGIPVDMGEVSIGPTVTQFTFKPAEGIKLSRITALNNNLALALAAHPIRIEAPIPGKSLVGVEVPNQIKAIVGLKEVLSAPDFKGRKNNLMIALGKDVSGKSWLYDLAKMPHLLVAGATNSGKSVCLNAVIISLLYQNNPDDLKFIMVDPKRVELPVYNGIPHLLTPVITEVSKTINALKWCLNEMDRRFEVLSQAGKKNIDSYNSSLRNGTGSRNGGANKMPYIIFIIDELADLMVAAARDIEAGIIRLAQMARAVGIHLVLATQRPSVDVITGLIKANMPARIAFSVASGVDSRTILDSLGAEKLLGRGDMLFIMAELSKPKRLQGAFVSEKEIKRIVNYIKEKAGEAKYEEGVIERQKVRGIAGVGMDGMTSDDDDELLEEAKELVINSDKASASFLQRRLSVGYARAARLLDLLEEQGVIGPGNGAKPREILINKAQYDRIITQGVSGVSLHNREETEAPSEFLPDELEDDKTAEVAEEKAGAEETGADEAAAGDDNNKDNFNDEEGKYFSK